MDKIAEFGEQAFNFISKNATNPIFWLILFLILLIIAWSYIDRIK